MDPERVETLARLIREKTRRLANLSQELRRLGACLEEELTGTSTSPQGGSTNGTQEENGRADARAFVAR